MSAFTDILGKVVTTVSGALGGGAVPAVISIGKDLLDLVDKARNVVASDDLPALDAMREELEPAVMAHADATEKVLRGQ
jgi:hypothetical protein